ncbi:MAG: DUF1152 domain-containing protein [Anaerolineae bacterium]
MHLNLPILDQLAESKSILIAGMGGGFDVFCGLPIYFELHRLGHTVHLANYSFSEITYSKGGTRLTETMVGVDADMTGPKVYFPEHYLSRWFRESQGEEVAVWTFQKTGVRPLLENYQILVEHLGIDAILLIDGGVDSLVRGDEAATGTLIEDTVSLIAVNELKNVPTRLLACIALGAELDMAYGHIMENIAWLARHEAFLGTCSLVSQMASYRRYEEAVLYTHQQPHQDPSVINASLVSAVQGHYGNYHLTPKTRNSRLWINPLMSMYWFFHLHPVARRNLIYDRLRWTDSREDLFRTYIQLQGSIATRQSHPKNIPL